MPLRSKKRAVTEPEPEDMGLQTAEPGASFANRLSAQLSGQFNQRDFADVEISVGETVIHAHRLVLCLQCSYFSDALRSSFKEGLQGSLNCEPGREQAYLRVLRYLYTGDYEEEPSTLIANEDDPELRKHPRVYFLADSFFIDDLKDLALKRFVNKLDKLWMSEGLVECIDEIYKNTVGDNNMKAAIIRIVVKNRKELLHKPSFKDLLSDGGDFAVDLVQALVADSGKSQYDMAEAMYP